MRTWVALLFLQVVFCTYAEAQYERFLIPTVANEPVPGAYGSAWMTEIVGRNTGPNELQLRCPVDQPFTCIELRVPPYSAFSQPVDTAINGAIIKLGSYQADDMILSVRARDVSRAYDTWGTEIPVVRESDLTATPVVLLNLPTSTNFRATIRMYDFGSAANAFLVTVLPLDGSEPLAELRVQAAPLRDRADVLQGIQFAVISGIALPASAPDRVRVRIRTAQPTNFWAFATVTHNETQHVTVISPGREATK